MKKCSIKEIKTKLSFINKILETEKYDVLYNTTFYTLIITEHDKSFSKVFNASNSGYFGDKLDAFILGLITGKDLIINKQKKGESIL